MKTKKNIPLFDPSDGPVLFQISPPESIEPVAPDGVVILDHFPVILGPTLLQHIRALSKARKTTTQWLSGTPFWKALEEHLRKTSTTNKCILPLKERAWGCYCRDVTINVDDTHVMAEIDIHNEQNHKTELIYIPSVLLTDFTKKEFDKWVRKLVKQNNYNNEYYEIDRIIRTKVISGKIDLRTIKRIVDAMEMEERIRE